MQAVLRAVFERVIGCGHVSGLLLRFYYDRWPVWSYADLVQVTSASSWLTDPDAFPDPLSPIFVLRTDHNPWCRNRHGGSRNAQQISAYRPW